MRVLSVDATNPDPEILAGAAEILLAGGLVAFPTETVYGLGADALNPQAVQAIYHAKGRPAHNPVIAHVVDIAQARELALVWPDLAAGLAEHFWPGPLTLVLKAAPRVPRELTGGGPTVAIRCPNHPIALGLLQAAGTPIAAPSANPSGGISPTTAEHVIKGLGENVDLILDGGPTPGGIESTVLDLSTDHAVLWRPGLISAAELAPYTGLIRIAVGPDTDDVTLPSPGLLARHYAPRTPTESFRTPALGITRWSQASRAGERVALLTFGTITGAPRETIVLPLDPNMAAVRLYATLHDLDGRGLDRILIALPPDTPVWEAIRDRLNRASSE